LKIVWTFQQAGPFRVQLACTFLLPKRARPLNAD
jgi:hypothetical protein